MATRLTKIIADFQTSLATILAVGATSATLASATDDDGVALPAGSYFFTIDGDNANKEHIVCDLSGTTISNIKSVSRQGVQTAGIVRVHRVGAQVILTDWAVLREITSLLDGTVALDASNPLIYDANPAITDAKHLATKKYIDDLAVAGGSKASTTVIGIAKLSVAPADPAEPIAVGNNDARIPTAGQKAALAGTGTPGAGNKYVTETDPNLANNVKTSGDQSVAGIKTFGSIPVLPASDPTTDNQAVRKAYVDALVAESTGNVVDGNTTIYYKKKGKLYFGFTAVDSSIQGNGYALGIYADATTMNRICALLSKTYASSTTQSLYGSNTGTNIGAKYASGDWTGQELGSPNSIAFLCSITVA